MKLKYRSEFVYDYYSAALWMLVNSSTIRATCKQFDLATSTFHLFLTKDLSRIDADLYGNIQSLLAHNKAQATIRGGEANKLRLLTLRRVKETQKYFDEHRL